MTLADHYEAFKAQLARGILTNKVSDVVRYNGDTAVRDNYAVLYPGAPKREDDRFMVINSVLSDSLFRYDVRYVGTSVAAVLLWQQRGQENLIPEGGVRLSVQGRRCEPIRLVDPVEEGAYEHDRDANLFFVDETYEFMSRRA
jgi:hypothetical protein